MTTLTDKSLLSGGDNKPPMLEKHLYDSWKSRMELYMMNRPHGRMILASVEKGPLVWPSITVDGVTRLKEYTELTPAEAIQADCDIKAINIILQGLPTEIYALVSQHRVAKDLWEKIKLLMQGTSLTKQERECKLYDEFDKFTYKKGESLHEYYLRFTLLLNDMNIYKMPLEQFQVNTKFLNTLPDEWSKFVTDVKLVKDLHTTNVDQLHAYLEQHERHANEVRLMHERNSDPLALVASHQITQSPYQTHQHTYQNTQLQQTASTYPSPQYVTYPSNDFQSSIHHNVYSPSSSIPRLEYASLVNQQSGFSQPETGLIVPVFQKGDDPIDAINHMMSFLLQLSPSEQVEAILENRGRLFATTAKEKATCPNSTPNQREKRDDSWYKEKVLLVQAQAHGQILNKEELTFLADPDIPESQSTQTEIFQRENSVSNQSVLSFDQLFELNELKAQSQEKDTVIKKLKERIKSLSGKMDKDKIKQDFEEIETINIELDHRVKKLIAKNEHLKQTYKQLYDSIKPAHIQSKEQCAKLISQVNLKSVEISDLNERLQTSTRYYEADHSLQAIQRKIRLQQTPVYSKNCSMCNIPSLMPNYELKYVKCNGCMLSDNHDLCVLDFINNVNAHAKSRSVKKNSRRKVWKPTGKVFTNIGYIWRPTGRTFTIVGNARPLTRITTTTKVPLRKPNTLDNDTPKPTATLVYSRKPRKSKTNVPVSNPKILQSVSANKKEPSKSWGSINSDVPSSSLDACSVLLLSVSCLKATTTKHVIAPGSSRNSSKESYGSNDMVHNYYLEEAKKKSQERDRKNWHASKSYEEKLKAMQKADHSRNPSSFSDFKHFVCSTCQKCVFNANHDACITKFLKEVNSRAKIQPNKTRNSNKPVDPTSHTQKPGRKIVTGHSFSPNKSSAVHEKTNTPRSYLRWIPTGRIFNTAGLKWVPTGKTFTSSTTKVDCELPNGSNDYITNPYKCDQTLNVSAGTLNLSADQHPCFMIMASVDNTSGPVPQRKESYKAVRLRYSNPMIQPEPEGSTQGYPLVSVDVLALEFIPSNKFPWDCQGGVVLFWGRVCEVRLKGESDGFVLGCRGRGDRDDE
ncbi:hypothetical protein Tco_1121280 [Tanacetum coccineum]|uniref:Integrase, catalytic region, zinc finger, CCHC-type, peptidase aspartic, catalytic n=1 Tax=Tanacetum coccineum TaxID=301880 RepID=A0ABQ5IYS5_9ASTR